MRGEEGEDDAFPSEGILEIGDRPRVKNFEAGEAAVRKETEKGDAASPSPERRAGEGGAKQTDPDEAAKDIHPKQYEQAVEEIDPDGIGERCAGVDRIIRPERNAAGQIPDISEMQGKIPEIVVQEHLDFVSIEIFDPKEDA